MTKQESLHILQSVRKKMDTFSNEELFNYMMENSPSFRADMKESKTENGGNHCIITITSNDVALAR
ncbi:MAG: hypothetical protein ACTTI3_02980 [Treponema sp.]